MMKLEIPHQMMVEPRPTAAQLAARQDDEQWAELAREAEKKGILEYTGQRTWSEKLGRWEEVWRRI
jgi:hypothetical protein